MDAKTGTLVQSADGESLFAAEAARVRASGTLGPSGRLVELFDYLAARGGDAPPASQAEIAQTVFGQTDADGDDATARVYIHRLRKRLEDFYSAEGDAAGSAKLVLPAGTYALRLATDAELVAAAPARVVSKRRPLLLALVPLAIVAAFLGGWLLRPSGGTAPPANAMWQPFLASDRPILVVVGDYYIFGEFEHDRPEATRLIRDFDINSANDLELAQMTNPKRYADTEDEGLNYLPMSSAYGLQALMPVLARHPKPITVIPASQLTSDAFLKYNVVYIGLLSGMGMLEDVNFMNSNFAVGGTYDELIEMASDKPFISGEGHSLTTPFYYKDYAYLSEFREPGGALVAVVASERETGLRGLAHIAGGASLPDGLGSLSRDPKGFEALFEVTGQQGADLGEKLVKAVARP
ncbi:MAG TPA: helix-turn-helix domain-containing protein [Planctomycetaceae bacterium]|nr:helix-turn-helix domain-containing protein [Planctomycetaceae bacterium]